MCGADRHMGDEWGHRNIQGVYRSMGSIQIYEGMYKCMGVYRFMGHTDIWGMYWGIQTYRGYTEVWGTCRCMKGCTDVWGCTNLLAIQTWGMYGGIQTYRRAYRCMGMYRSMESIQIYRGVQIYGTVEMGVIQTTGSTPTYLPTTPGYYIYYKI